ILFFQAEDGIRDRNVTGVQTCALPIFIFRILFSDMLPSSKKQLTFLSVIGGWGGVLRPHFEQKKSRRPFFRFAARCAAVWAAGRSEERRVGKECSDLWGTGESIRIR